MGLSDHYGHAIGYRPSTIPQTSQQVTSRFPEAVVYYLRTKRVEGCTQATIENATKELRAFERHLEARGHGMAVVDISAVDITEHLEEMRGKGRAPNHPLSPLLPRCC